VSRSSAQVEETLSRALHTVSPIAGYQMRLAGTFASGYVKEAFYRMASFGMAAQGIEGLAWSPLKASTNSPLFRGAMLSNAFQ